jgi:uncharacterized phage-like protein YoqJ
MIFGGNPNLAQGDKSLAVTGHQPFLLGGYGHDVSRRLRRVAFDWLQANTPREVMSGLAAGWDTAVADAAVSLGIPLIAALAYRGQADLWPEEARNEHARLVAAAGEIYLYAEAKEHGCFTRRDRWVLERGDMVLALWSGVDGGTARAIATANKLEKPVVNVWERWASLETNRATCSFG